MIRNDDRLVRGAIAIAAAACALGALVVSTVNLEAEGQTSSIDVYSGRHYNTDKELYKQFTKETGIKVNLLEAKDDALLARLKEEGKNSPADVLILADAARLHRAAEAGLYQSVESSTLEARVPKHLRDDQNRWFALTRRLRVPIVNPDMVSPDTIKTYADLTKPALKGKLCLRNRKSVYQQSLVAYQIDRMGTPATEKWIRGMVANLGEPFYSSDTPQIRDVARGKCGVAVVNTYYVGRMQAGDKGAEDKALGDKVVFAWPKSVHANVTGAGVTKHSDAPAAAKRFIEFLASSRSQNGYAEANHEYPLVGTGSDPVLKRWGSPNVEKVNASVLGNLNRQAISIMSANGWD